MVPYHHHLRPLAFSYNTSWFTRQFARDFYCQLFLSFSLSFFQPIRSPPPPNCRYTHSFANPSLSLFLRIKIFALLDIYIGDVMLEQYYPRMLIWLCNLNHYWHILPGMSRMPIEIIDNLSRTWKGASMATCDALISYKMLFFYNICIKIFAI